MNTPRFDYEPSPDAPSRLRPPKYSKWIPVSDIDDWLRHDSTRSRRRRIFAIVTPPMPAHRGYKTIRRVLIFDDHPDTLRLVSERRLNPDIDRVPGRVHPTGGLAAPRPASHWRVIFGVVLIMILGLAMLWPLFMR